MIFIILAIIGFVLYVVGQRILSLVIFFFFITNGYQFLPLELFETEIGIKQALDYAIIQAFLIFIFCLIKDYRVLSIKDNFVNRWLLFFILTFGVIIVFNILILGIPVGQVLKTIRPYILLSVFYSFRVLSTKDFQTIKNFLMLVTVLQCFLFIAQVFLNEQFLNGYFGGSKMEIGEIELTRCYNIPMLLPYFLFQALFSTSNKSKDSFKVFTQILFFFTLLMPMHRSWILSLLTVVMYGIFLKANTQKKLVKYILLFGIFLLPIGGMILDRFQSSNIKEDINSATSGSFEDFDFDLDSENTLFYRVAHLYERLFYISEDWKTLLWGGGLMTEESDEAKDLNFFVTFYSNETRTEMMISTPDIAWSMMFFRLGTVGTLFYMFFYCSLMFFFYKYRKNLNMAIGTYLFLIFTIFTSFTSVELITIWPLMLPALDYAQGMARIKKDELSTSMNETGLI